jgi:3-methyladenine DNA glycosylase AlkD
MQLPQQPEPRELADYIEQRLRSTADPARAVAEKRYLKSDLQFIGASVPAIRQAAIAVKRSHPGLDRATLTGLVQELWRMRVHERRMAAVELLILYQDRLEPGDFSLVEALLRDARTWALVDPLAITVAGRLIQRFPHVAGALDRWAVDADFWVRRASLLALLGPLRDGHGDFDRFARYADQMCEEREFFIRKAIGWVLRELGKTQPDLVFAWLAPRAARVSGVTMREALKYLPVDRRDALIEAYRQRIAASADSHVA